MREIEWKENKIGRKVTFHILAGEEKKAQHQTTKRNLTSLQPMLTVTIQITMLTQVLANRSVEIDSLPPPQTLPARTHEDSHVFA